jgi:DNA (cytosine-5)-methyltransferase 1
MAKKLKAIDLYSGIGGWTLGLKMAGINIVKSYEWWSVANETHNKNFGTNTPEIDIRKLELSDLPHGINIVVGSPPCTQFSFSNRGGKGDIADGLKDIAKFLNIVEHYKSKGSLKYWAMENVPRVSEILKREIKPGGQLEKYASLIKVNRVVNSADYGLPQRRKRMIAGDFPVAYFEEYRNQFTAPTLGQVIESLTSETIIDANYGTGLDKKKLTDHVKEKPLTPEEKRINEAQKKFHTVYNKMNFPELSNTTSRTITATCTRVSRESVIIKAGRGGFRRLTIRERATLQGFPITYQFYGKTYSNRLKMIGNAIPPLLTYFIASSMLERGLKFVNPRTKLKYHHEIPLEKHLKVKPERNAKKYSTKRMFRFSIRPLRFGSGVGFELRNEITNIDTQWSIRYFHGSSKAIKEIPLQKRIHTNCLKLLKNLEFDPNLDESMKNVLAFLSNTSGRALQSAWTHSVESSADSHPFILLDELEAVSESMYVRIKDLDYEAISKFVLRLHSMNPDGRGGFTKKISVNAHRIFIGFLMGSWFNSKMK